MKEGALADMVKYYRSVDNILLEENSAKANSWIALTNPTAGEILDVAEDNGILVSDLKAALDDEERSRIEVEDDYTMILVDIPTIETRDERDWYITIPMSIIVKTDRIITVCLQDTPVLQSFVDGRVKHFNTGWRSRFILQILYRNTSWFIHYLRMIDKESDDMEKKLGDGSTTNNELIELMGLEKSLVYFKTSLRSNEVVLEKLVKLPRFEKYPSDEELLEDVIIENKQAIEMANIYSGILEGMMNAFSSVISNNLNQVMKILASVTIVLSIPTMVSSFYGMNVNTAGMPFADNVNGFLIIIIFALILSLLVALILKIKKMF